jgi:prepilin-type N-terminal cleavage/methylation domain-containing protein
MKSPIARGKKPPQNSSGRHQGFSLVETIVAFVILGIILLALTLVPIMSTRLMGDTVEREKAVLLAVGKLDEISTNFASIPTGGATSSDTTHSPYSIEWTSSADSTDSKLVTLTITWPGIMKQQTLEFKRQVTNVD